MPRPKRDPNAAILDLEAPLSKSAFADLLDIAPSTVSKLYSGGVLAEGMSARQMLQAFARHAAVFRRMAPKGSARERLTTAQAEREELKLAVESGQFAAVELMTRQMARVASIIATRLQAIPVDIARRDPGISTRTLQTVQAAVARACDEAVEAAVEALPLDNDPDAEAADA